MHQPKLAPIDFRTLKQQVGVLDVLRLMKWEPSANVLGGKEFRGPCPVHGSSSPSSVVFAVNPEKNAWKCFKCGAGGNQLDLAAHHFGISKEQSVKVAVALCRELGVSIPRTEEKRS